MKRSIILFLTAFIAFASSCSSDNTETTSNTGELVVNGQTFPLTKAYLIPNYTGSNPNYDSRRFYITLTNGDVSIIDNEFVFGDNITQLVDFNLYTSTTNSGTIQQTTYPIFSTTPNINNNDAFLEHSSINTNIVIQNNNLVSADELSSDDFEGNVKITINNEIYTIIFSFQNDENTVSGTYTGTLSNLNYSYD